MKESKFYQRLQQSEEGRVYLSLIEKVKERELVKEEGFEFHHIFPKGLGGSQEGKVVKLSFGEHGEAHRLLAKVFGGKMLYAYSLMTRAGKLDENLREKAHKKVKDFLKEHEVWKKSKKTKEEKYGKVWVNAHTEKAKSKRKKTLQTRYGNEYAYLQTEDVRKRRKATMISRYGSVMGACHTPEAEKTQRERRLKTMEERYGSSSAQLHTKEARRKALVSRRKHYEERGLSMMSATHSPEAEAKRAEKRKLKKQITTSEEYRRWYERSSRTYYHFGDGVLDYLKEVGKTLEEFKG